MQAFKTAGFSLFKKNKRDGSVSQIAMGVLAILVGIIAGFGAVLFRYMIDFVHNMLFLGHADLTYNAQMHTPANPWGWGIILVPVIGAVGVAWLVKTFAPEAKGHGVPEVMDAIYLKEGKIRPIVAFVKSLASALSIGSGGAVGREGPIVQIGSAFGSTVGSILSMPAWQSGILIAAGATGGIAATFNAPIGALAFGIELMLASVSAITLFPVAIATVTATYIGRLCLGSQPAFYVKYLTIQHFHLVNIGELILFIPFGILLGLLSVMFIRGVYWFEDKFDQMPGTYYTRHVSGMFLMGVVMYIMFRFAGHYYVQGLGYATVLDILRGVLAHPWFLLFLVLAKWFGTCLTLGSGASGGIFSPSLFLGACLGGSFGLLMQHIIPGMHIDPAIFAIAGMAGMISGSTGAVLTAVTMVPEMVAGSVDFVLPIILAATIAYVVRKLISNENIYTLKLLRRGSVVPEGLQSAVALAHTAEHVMNKTFRLVSRRDLQDKQSVYFNNQWKNLVTVVTENNLIKGIWQYPVIQNQDAHDELEAYLDKNFLVVSGRAKLPDILRSVKSRSAKYVLVTAPFLSRKADHVVGVISEHELVESSYKTLGMLYK